MANYSPAQAFGPCTFGFGGEALIDAKRTIIARIRNIIDGDDALGFIFAWQGTTTTAPTDITHKVALFSLDNSREFTQLRKIVEVQQTRTLAATTSHGRLEHLQVAVQQLDPQRTYCVAIQSSYTSAHWSVGPYVRGMSIQPAAASFSNDVGSVLVFPSIGGDIPAVVDVSTLYSGGALCPGVGLSTARVRVVGFDGTESFLF